MVAKEWRAWLYHERGLMHTELPYTSTLTERIKPKYGATKLKAEGTLGAIKILTQLRKFGNSLLNLCAKT